MSKPKKQRPGDPYIAFGRALNNGKTTVSELVKAAFACGLIIGFTAEPDPAQSLDIEVK